MNSFPSVIPCPPAALFIMILDFPMLDGSCRFYPAFFARVAYHQETFEFSRLNRAFAKV